MKNAITTLRIQNFKSIKDVEMKPRRVNIIIGEPNVGKSNILEAMSLLGGGGGCDSTKKFMGMCIRYEEIRQIFYDNLLSNAIKIETDQQLVFLGIDNMREALNFIFLPREQFIKLREIAKKTSAGSSYPFETEDGWLTQHIDSYVVDASDIEKLDFEARLMEGSYSKLSFKGDPIKSRYFMSAKPVGEIPLDYQTKTYSYAKRADVNRDTYITRLMEPHGDNLLTVIQAFPELRKEIARMFEPYGLKLMLRIDERRIEIVKDLDGVIYSYPYSSTADTLQRLIFYLAAIESNDDAVILFEEPEAHSFPVYVSQLGQRIVESRNNQFFVVTHSPYLITEILEEMLTDDELTPELAMFVAYYEDYQTKVRQLSDEEVLNIRRDGLDVFYNMDRFIPQR